MSSSWINPYKKQIDSFPGRLFTFNDPQQDKRDLLDEISNYSDWICEIGSGSGGHLIESGQRSSTAAFIGFEIRYKRAFRTIEKARTRGVENVYLCRTRGEALSSIFPEESLSGIFVNFPDPWGKKRWKKHQILTMEFLDRAKLLLKPGGFVSVKTDHLEYFEEFFQISSSHPSFTLLECSRDLHGSEFASVNIETEFERLFCSQGLAINYLKLAKKTVVAV